MKAHLSSLWEYGRWEIPFFLWCLMELALLVPLSYALMPWARYWPPVPFLLLLLCLMLVPFNLIRLLSALNVSIDSQRRYLLAGLLVALFATLRALLYDPDGLFAVRWIGEMFAHVTASGYPFWARDFAVIGLVLFCWWRGIRLGERGHNVDTAGLRFRVAALLGAPFVLFLGRNRFIWDPTPFIVLFCLTSLLIIALTRAQQVEEEATGFAFPMTPRWLAVVTLASVVVVVGGWFFVATAMRESILRGPQTAVLFALYVVFYTLVNLVGPSLFVVVEYAARWLQALLRPLVRWIASLDIDFPAVQEPEINLEQTPEEALDLSYIPSLIVILLVAAIVFLIILTLQRAYRHLRSEDTQRSREPRAGGGERGQTEPASWWDRLRGRFSELRHWRTALSIRRIYAQMARAAADEGYPRGRSETPYEYLAQLKSVWPTATAETQRITNAYVRVRYGEIPETQAELSQIYAAWKTLQALLKERGVEASFSPENLRDESAEIPPQN